MSNNEETQIAPNPPVFTPNTAQESEKSECNGISETKPPRKYKQPDTSIIGKTYGNFTVLSYSHVTKSSGSYWDCRCVCGELKIMSRSCVLHQRIKSCGCLRNKNMVGKTFGNLTVLSYDSTRKGITFWNCKCVCGNTKVIQKYAITSGATKGCGCIKRNQTGKNHHNFTDLTGQRFGKLLVESISGTQSGKSIQWNCLCDCGNRKKIISAALNGGMAQSCGCLKYSKGLEHKNTIDLTGKRFGKLLVKNLSNTKPDSIQKNPPPTWDCICDCGREKTISGHDLRRGHTTSCGCFRREVKLSNYLAGQRFGKLTVIKRTVLKDEPKRFRWECLCDCGNVLYLRSDYIKSKRKIGCRKCYRGPLHQSWKPSLSDEERNRKRNVAGYEDWRNSVYERDDYTCQVTGESGNIRAHHFESWSSNKELRLSVDNGITILESVHILFHSQYGQKNNTKIQFEEFVANLTKEDIKELIEEDEGLVGLAED